MDNKVSKEYFPSKDARPAEKKKSSKNPVILRYSIHRHEIRLLKE